MFEIASLSHHLDWEQVALIEGAILISLAAYKAGRSVEKDRRRRSYERES